MDSITGNDVHMFQITDGINLIRTWDNRVLAKEDSPLETPHNLVMVYADYQYKIYVTQSGGEADQVTVYRLTWRGIEYDSTVTTDLNPFGITHIPAYP